MSITEMVDSMKKAGLVLSGAVAGVLLSVGLTAYADKQQGVGIADRGHPEILAGDGAHQRQLRR